MHAITTRYGPGTLAQLLRFGIAGGGVTLVNTAAYGLMATRAGLAPLVANLLAYVVAVACGYAVHSRWSFRGHGSGRRGVATASRFLAASLASLGLNTAFVWVLTGPLHGPAWWPVPPMLFVTPLAAFALNRAWVFR